MSDLISFDQLCRLTDVLDCSVDYYQDALSRAIDVLHNQKPINSAIVIPDTTFDVADRVSTIEPMSFPTELIPLQCTSCGVAIDKDTMTCKHCGMTFMLR